MGGYEREGMEKVEMFDSSNLIPWVDGMDIYEKDQLLCCRDNQFNKTWLIYIYIWL